MAKFEVYRNPGSHSRATPYLLDVQSDLLDGLESCMVIPLRSLDSFVKVKVPTRLTPVVHVEGQDYLLETPKMGAVPRSILKSPVASLAAEQFLITSAVDFLFHGF
jgi:toxin CcdB